MQGMIIIFLFLVKINNSNVTPLGEKNLCVIVYNWKSQNKENKQNISSVLAYVDINKTIFVILLRYLIVWWKKVFVF